MLGKVTGFLRSADLESAERAALDQGVTVRRVRGTPCAVAGFLEDVLDEQTSSATARAAMVIGHRLSWNHETIKDTAVDHAHPTVNQHSAAD